ncbi:MAG: adenylosuccinate lyase [Acholeplasmataceae bacterium]
MIDRYQTPQLKKLWSEQNKYNTWLKLEMMCSRAWHELGVISKDDFNQLSKASFKLSDVRSFEASTKHDVIAFIKAVSLSLGDEQKWFHYGLTSTDVVDSAQSMILRDVNQIIIKDIDRLLDVLREKAITYKTLKTIGRTHGIHAEPTSFGLKFLLWYNDLVRLKSSFLFAAKNVEVIKLSGAVGNYAANTPKLQSLVASYLKLDQTLIATQTLQRDRHANYMANIALIGAQLDKMAIEIRHLSRTEVGEVMEYFAKDQKGSSAMPHKKNPIASENISGLSRVLKGYMLTAFENIGLWHERDISHSSTERIILADGTSLIDYMLTRFTNVLENLLIREDIVIKNIDQTYGSIYSQRLLSYLINHGALRNDAYDWVQSLAQFSVTNHVHLKTLCLKDPEISKILTEVQIEEVFDDHYYLRYIDDIYQNVL